MSWTPQNISSVALITGYKSPYNDVNVLLPNGRSCPIHSVIKKRVSIRGGLNYHQGKLIDCGGCKGSGQGCHGNFFMWY